MIEYEITVNVEGLTHDEKKRVQDAFFKLGFTWWGGDKYSQLDKDCYTNKTECGEVTQYIMWAEVDLKPTHTIDELLGLVRMKKQNAKPFDLEKALAGEPVVLRNGTKAYVRHRETRLKTDYPMIGYVEEGGTVDNMLWTEDGHEHVYKVKSEYDIVGMWVEPLVFEHWDLLHEDIKYLVRDIEGDWCGYTTKPSLHEFGWHYGDGKTRLHTVLSLSAFPVCDWRHSLIKRPGNE